MIKKTKPEDEQHGWAVAAAGEPPASKAGEAGTDQQGEASKADPEALASLASENAELKDRLLRALAETENVRRRAARDLDAMRQYAVTKFAGDMLSVADNLERAIASIPAKVREGEGAVQTLIEGVELTQRDMQRALEKHDVKKLVPLGERFDPNFHQAMFMTPDPSVPAGTVTNVVEAGYSIGSRPLRPAKVGIAGSGSPNPSAPKRENGTGR